MAGFLLATGINNHKERYQLRTTKWVAQDASLVQLVSKLTFGGRGVAILTRVKYMSRKVSLDSRHDTKFLRINVCFISPHFKAPCLSIK